MKPRTKLLLILLLGLIIRLVLYDHLIINYDDGLYLHDAYQVTNGQIPVIDYPSRSPLYHILLAVYYYLPFDIILSYRLIQYGFAAITTLFVYLVTKELSNTNTALLAAALYYLNPYLIGYGSWIKTEVLATGFILAAAYTLLQAFDPENNASRYLALTGAILGAGVLIRRSVLIAGLLIGIYVFWYYRWNPIDMTRHAVSYSVGAITGTLGLYLILAKGNPHIAYLLFDVHLLDLVQEGGFGAFEYIHFPDLNHYLKDNYLRDWPLFRKFGSVVLTRFEGMIRENILLVIPIIGYYRGFMAQNKTKQENRRMDQYILVGFFVFFALLLVRHTAEVALFYLDGHSVGETIVFSRPTIQTTLILLAIVLHRYLPRIPIEYAITRHRRLIWWLLIWILFSYFARNRILYMSYWLDLLPYAVILSAIAYTYYYHNTSFSLRSKGVLSVFFALIIIVSLVTSSPLLHSRSPDQFTPEYAHTIRNDVITHSDPGDTVLAAQPLFVLGTDRNVALDLGRQYYFIREAPGSPFGDELAIELEQVVCDSAVVIDGPAFSVLTEYNPGIRAELERCHKRVGSYAFDVRTGDENTRMIHVYKRR